MGQKISDAALVGSVNDGIKLPTGEVGDLGITVGQLKAYIAAFIAAGDVVGPAGATDGAVALYDGITGKLLKNSAIIPTSVGIAIANLANPSAVTFIRINADNSVTARTPSESLTDLYAGYTADTTPLDTDEVFGHDTVSGFNLRTTWVNIKTFLNTYFAGIYQVILTAANFGDFIVALTGKTTPVGADSLIISDSAASDDAKKVSLTNFMAAIFTSPTLTGTVTLPKVKLTGTPAVDKTVSGPSTDTFQAGESITEFQLCYYKSDGKWWKADADSEAIASLMLGVSLETKTAGNAMSTALAGCFIRNDAWNWTVGAKLYMSTTDGAITETMPTGTVDVVRIIGYAVSADVIYFNPSGSYVTHI